MFRDDSSSTTLILIDTNALINAALLPRSFSAQALRLAVGQRGFRFLVTGGVMREVRKILDHRSPNPGRANLAERRVREWIGWLAALVVDDDDSSDAPSGIPRSDHHVFHAALRHGATVLTTDARLWAALPNRGVSSVLPLEWIRQLDRFTIQNVIFGVTPTGKEGSLFARAYPGSWPGSRRGKFTVASFPGAFWIYYNAAISCWVAEVNGLPKPIECKSNIVDSSLQTVCLSWSTNGKKPAVTLRVNSVERPGRQPLLKPIDFRPSGNATVGNSHGAAHCWNGHIYFCVSNDKPVSKKSWDLYQRSPELAPNPYDADRVAAALHSL